MILAVESAPCGRVTSSVPTALCMNDWSNVLCVIPSSLILNINYTNDDTHPTSFVETRELNQIDNYT